MKKAIMLNTILLSLAVALWGCGGDDEDNNSAPSGVTITASPESITAKAEGGTFTINVTTTYSEWGAVADAGSFFTVKTQDTNKASGTITVTVPKNPNAEERSSNVVIMSGTARKTITITQEAAEENEYYAPDGYKLVWHDEFDVDGELNENDWTHEVQGDHWVNNELQNYVNHVSPGGNEVTSVNGGTLKIRCFKENGKIYSGRVYAHVSTGWQYGYIEAKMKLPKGKGTWPAFWMMPVTVDWANEGWPKCGEIDIMEEVGCVPNEVSSSLHAEGHVHTNNTQVTHAMTIANAEGEFHTYAIEWSSSKIITYVDGKVQLEYASDGTVRNYPYNKPFYVIFNLAWGGSWGGMYGVDESALPVTLEIDYLRVFQK